MGEIGCKNLPMVAMFLIKHWEIPQKGQLVSEPQLAGQQAGQLRNQSKPV